MGFSIVMVLFSFIIAIMSVPILVWIERRAAGLIQDRMGPNRCNVGGVRFGGLIQGVADMLKLLFKEEYLPPHIQNRYIYLLAPSIVFGAAYLTFTVIPFADTFTLDGHTYLFQAMPVELGALWFLAFAGLSVYGIILAGWASHNKYGLLGALRASAQVISYEASMGLALVSMIVLYGSIYLNDIVAAQGGVLFGFLPAWGVVQQPLAALLFIVTAFAETNRAPFDSAEGESEIVAGYHTEYSSMRFALFFMGEYMAMAASAALIVTLFFGGYQIPWLDTETLRSHIREVAVGVMTITPLLLFGFWHWVVRNTRNPLAYMKKERGAVAILTLTLLVGIELLFGLFLLTGFSDASTQISVDQKASHL